MSTPLTTPARVVSTAMVLALAAPVMFTPLSRAHSSIAQSATIAPADPGLTGDQAARLAEESRAVQKREALDELWEDLRAANPDADAHLFEDAVEAVADVTDDHVLTVSVLREVIMEESNFFMGDVSLVGAKGLMQLMPNTAAEVARKMNVPWNEEWLLTRPDYNIRLGTALLRSLYDMSVQETERTIAEYARFMQQNTDGVRQDWFPDPGELEHYNVHKALTSYNRGFAGQRRYSTSRGTPRSRYSCAITIRAGVDHSDACSQAVERSKSQEGE